MVNGSEKPIGRSESHSLKGYHPNLTNENMSNFAPTKNRLKMEELEQEMLSKEAGLTYVHELQYSNGAVYRGQIKSVDKLRTEKIEMDGILASSSRASVNNSINDKERASMRHSVDDRS